MLLFLPFLLAGPLLLLAEAVVTLWGYGPLGWLASAGLLVAVVVTTQLLCRRCVRWWRGTKAPVRPARP